MEAVKLLAASQPDIVRANQKDEAYIDQYADATHEVVRRLLGPFRALQYARESKLLALLLYHGLTTGMGQSTLGEEYCGMLQVAGSSCHMPGPRRRLLLALLLSVGPYVADRLAGQLDNAAEEAAEAVDELHSRRRPSALSAAAVNGTVEAEAAAEPGTSAERDNGEMVGRPCDPWVGGRHDQDAAMRQPPRREVGGGPGSAAVAAVAGSSCVGRGSASGQGWLQLLLAVVAARWFRSWRHLVLSWPRLRPLLSYAGRLHLALFYAYGAYYSLAHRLAGVRYSLSMRPLQGRPSYGVLGALLGLQLAVTAVLKARAALRSHHRSSVTAAAAANRGASAMRRRRGLLGDDDNAADVGGEQFYAAEDEPAVFLDDDYEDEHVDIHDNEEEEEEEERGGWYAEEAKRDMWPPGGVRMRKGLAADDGQGSGSGPRDQESARGTDHNNGGSSSGSGGVAAVEGWEKVERLDGAAGGSGWEADVFGSKSGPPLPSQQQQQPTPRSRSRGTVEGAPTALRTNTAMAGSTSSSSSSRHGGGGSGAAAGAVSGVLPVLTSLRQCPLCLSSKSHPTSTPCGHVFCWGCITTWCVEKPECPLCRSSVQLPQLVALYHTNC